MSISLKAVAGVTAAAVVGASMVGCTSNSKSPTTSSSSGSATSTSHSSASNSAQPQSADYTKLLIQASDINAPEVFKAGPITQNPNGHAGVESTFSNEDGTHVIRDTILVMNDPSAAASALDSAKAKLGDSVKGTPGPANVGTGGTTASGDSPDGSKGVTMVLFTEGKAFTTLEFDGPAGTPAPPDFVTDVAQKQDTAIKNGLPG
ncbi:MAG: hypothetical protein QOD88_2685 [Mycobacterium sp.]|jgi:hypothetical protein|nr:hypothetical protein [Mycobacterium sp.]